MPELPEVETVRRGLEPAMAGATIMRAEVRRPDLRIPFPSGFADRLAGRRIVGLGRRAKYLLAELDGGEVLVMHLGMSGSFRIELEDEIDSPGRFHHARSKAIVHDHVLFHLSNDVTVTYNDPRRFGLMLLVGIGEMETHPLFAGLGIEPVGNQLDGGYLDRHFKGRRTPLKAALLDQRVIAGLGNIYVCEALHRARLSPRRLAHTITRARGGPGDRALRLAEAIRKVIGEAIAAGGSTLRDYVQTDGSLGYFQHSFRVYGREGAACPTPGCGGRIHRIVQSGRSTFHCPLCQA